MDDWIDNFITIFFFMKEFEIIHDKIYYLNAKLRIQI